MRSIPVILSVGCMCLLASVTLGAGLADPEAASQPSDLPQADIPAFPGAEGAGAFTPGGRGGKVYVVTTLEDYNPMTEPPIPGSFRAACQAEGPRIVVFAVSGIITLKAPLRIPHPYITIAGQTAPGDGICVRNETTRIDTHDVVIRHVRFRRGSLFRADDALGGYPVGNIMIDHVSASWGLDENLSIYRHMHMPPGGDHELKLPVVNVTIQWSITSEALNPRNHAFGGTWGGRNTSFHHNLFACNTGRNPSIGMTFDFNFINNVIFNWRHRSMDGGDSGSWGNIINNYFKPGPATRTGSVSYRILKPQSDGWHPPGSPPPTALFGRWYVAGNYVLGNPQVTADNWTAGVQFEGRHSPEELSKLIEMTRATEPFPMAPVRIQPAEQAYEVVLARAGATLPKRDPVDQRIVQEVRTGQVTYGNGIIADPAQVGGWPEYKSTPAPADRDGDGMSDAWETRCGLNPADAADAAADKDGDGYTNIEEYLNGTDPTQFVDYKNPANNIDTLSPAD